MIEKIISGGQTGVDQMGLQVAEFLNIETGGTAPKGYRTEIGPDLSLRDRYHLKESWAYSYQPRTHKNILDADGTVLFGNERSPGSRESLFACRQYKKPFIINPSAEQLKQFIKENKIKILNVAGNRASKIDAEELGIYTRVLIQALSNEH